MCGGTSISKDSLDAKLINLGSLDDLTDSAKEFFRDFLDRLPDRNKNAIEKVKKYCVPKKK
jgi:hypothetical protein